MELSPFFLNYVKNVHYICQRVYAYLHTEQGEKLLEAIQEKLPNKFNPDSNKYGELEVLSNMHEMIK